LSSSDPTWKLREGEQTQQWRQENPIGKLQIKKPTSSKGSGQTLKREETSVERQGRIELLIIRLEAAGSTIKLQAAK
jgi:hypothetical protein